MKSAEDRLRKRLRDSQARERRLRGVLAQLTAFGTHRDTCVVRRGARFDNLPCDCGLQAAIDALSKHHRRSKR